MITVAAEFREPFVRSIIHALHTRLRATDNGTVTELHKLIIVKPDDSEREFTQHLFTAAQAIEVYRRYQPAVTDLMVFEPLPLGWRWIGGDMKL